MPGCNAPSNASSICSIRALNQLHNMDAGGGAAPRAERRSGGRARDRRIVRARRDRRHHRPDGALAGSADALLPGQAARGAGAVRRRSHRHACSARSKTPASTGSSIRATRAWCRRTTSSSSRWSAVPIRIRPTRASSRPARGTLPPDLDEIGRRYIGALADEIAKWLTRRRSRDGRAAPIGVSFSGGIDSGSVFLVTYHTMLRLGLSPARLKAFVLNLGRRTRRRAGARSF